MNQDKSKCDEAHQALDVELDQPATSLPVEALPGINEAYNSSATQSLGHNLSAKRTVKRHSGVLVLGQDGSLDADLSNGGRQAQEKRASDGDEDNSDPTTEKASPLSSAVVGEVVLTRLLVEPEESDEAHGKVERGIRHGSSDGSWQGENLPLLGTRNAAPEADITRGGNDLVGPSGVQVRGGGTGEGRNENKAEGQHLGNDSLGQLHYPAHGKGGDQLVAEAPPASKLAALSDEMTDGAADGRGNGLLMDEGDGGAGLEKTLLLILGSSLIVMVGNGDGCGRGFDHSEYGQEICKCVLDLSASVSSAWLGEREQHRVCQRTRVIATIDATKVTISNTAPQVGI